MRITRSELEHGAEEANRILGLPVMQTEELADSVIFSVGHIHVEHSNTGYGVYQTTTPTGGVRTLRAQLTAQQCQIFLDGLTQGALLCSASPATTAQSKTTECSATG